MNTTTSTSPPAAAAPLFGKRVAAPKHKMRIRDFLSEVLKSDDLRRSLPRLAIAATLANFLAVTTPMAILQIMDRIVVNHSLHTLALLVIGIVIALMLEELLKLISGHVTGWLGARFEHHANVAALDHMMRVPLPVYQKEEPGAYEEKILAASQVAEFYGGQTILTLFDLPFVFIFLGLIFAIGGWLVLAPMGVLLTLVVFLVFFFGNWMQDQNEQRVVLDNRRYNFLTEVLGNMGSIKALTMESLMLRRYERLMESNAEQGEKLTRANEYNLIIGIVFAQVMTVAVVFFGIGAVLDEKISPGSLAACMMLAIRTLMLVRKLLAVWLKFQHFAANQVRYNEVMQMPAELDAGKPSLPPVEQGIELRDVCLKQDDGQYLFDGLSLSLKAGECIAIQGNSGSGKSTLLSLIGGLIRPDTGSCAVDGQLLQGFNADSVPRQISLLPQASTAMTGTILENITMFDESLTYDALRIGEQIGLDQIVTHLKLGYETPIGATETLTEGALQLINIVRATCSQPSVILFDEANTSLDMQGDALVREYLASLKGKRTLVLVTYRPSLLSLADRVYTISERKLVAGTLEANRKAFVETATVAPVEVPPRPPHIDDLPEVIRRQFDEQSDFSACLEPMLKALGWVGQPRALVEAMPHLTVSMDITAFCAITHNLKFSMRRSVASLHDIVPSLLPCLFVASEQPAQVILECLPNGNLRIFDGATHGEREVERNEHEGQCYMFKKGDKKGPAVTGWFGDLVWTFRKKIMLVFGLTLLSTLLGLSTPLFVMMSYDRVLPSHDSHVRYYLLLGVCIAALLDCLVRKVRIDIMASVGGRFEYILGTALLQRIIHLPTAATEGTSVNKQVGRIKGLEGLRDFIQGPLAMMTLELPANLALLFAIAWISPIVLVVLFGTGLLYAGLIYFTKMLAERHLVMTTQLAGNRSEFLTETLAKMRAIRAAGATHKWLKRFRSHSGKAIMANFLARRVHERVSGIVAVIGTSTGLVALAASATVAMDGKVTSGDMVAAMMICWRLVGPLQQLFSSASSIARMRQNMQQVENLMRMQGEKDGGSTVAPSHRSDKEGLLNFSRVSFRYAIDADPALLGVNFTINPGAIVVIAGGNGSGKSTLLKLIERIYQPQAGAISLDNVDIRQMAGADLRSHITYMPQSCDIFYGTVAQNLRVANPAATDDEMKWAVEMAGLTDDILTLPRGFDTRISTNSAKQMPLGFRQRLSLARTILKDAPVVLLDEPGTGLNEAGELALTRCVEYWRGRSTVVMASHRPSHMRMADMVIYMERGSITASGTFDEIKTIVMAGPR
ncbi:MAG: ATP-binding cassette domain-containing protein [Pseudomonadota bacterium]